MYLTVNNQLTLLHDLLDEQLLYEPVTDNEYKRIKSLVRSLMTDRNRDVDLTTLLPEIYYFCIKGENAHSFNDHIYENETNIKKWMENLNQIKEE